MRTLLHALGLLLVMPAASRAQPVPAPCEKGADGIRLEAPATADQAGDARGCQATIPFTVKSCTPRAVVLTGLIA
jgi:hypothetical protein